MNSFPFLATGLLLLGFAASIPGQQDGDKAIQEAIRLLEAKRAAAATKADRDRISEGIAALQKLVGVQDPGDDPKALELPREVKGVVVAAGADFVTVRVDGKLRTFVIDEKTLLVRAGDPRFFQLPRDSLRMDAVVIIRSVQRMNKEFALVIMVAAGTPAEKN